MDGLTRTAGKDAHACKQTHPLRTAEGSLWWGVHVVSGHEGGGGGAVYLGRVAVEVKACDVWRG